MTRALILLALALALVSCGGGGDTADDDTPQAPRTIRPELPAAK